MLCCLATIPRKCNQGCNETYLPQSLINPSTQSVLCWCLSAGVWAPFCFILFYCVTVRCIFVNRSQFVPDGSLSHNHEAAETITSCFRTGGGTITDNSQVGTDENQSGGRWEPIRRQMRTNQEADEDPCGFVCVSVWFQTSFQTKTGSEAFPKGLCFSGDAFLKAY